PTTVSLPFFLFSPPPPPPTPTLFPYTTLFRSPLAPAPGLDRAHHDHRERRAVPRAHALRARGRDRRGGALAPHVGDGRQDHDRRSEEHTSELQSPCNLVCRLLLEKKK